MQINQHYYNRYVKFIEVINTKQDRILNYSENHHIIPRSMGGSDLSNNLIKLTAREHFIAHWLLWKAYPSNFKLAFAFWAMCNLPSNGRDYFEKLNNHFKNSKIYEQLKTEVSVKSSELHTNRVYVFDPIGDRMICLTKTQYKKSTLKFHTTGMINVYNKIDGKSQWITSTEYQLRKDEFYTNVFNAKYRYIDSDHNEHLLTKTEAINLKNMGIELKQLLNIKIKTIDKNGNKKLISSKKYNKEKHMHINKNKFSVLDLSDNIMKFITKEEYNLNPKKYMTSTKGKVLAYNKLTNKPELIDKTEFDKNKNYVGQSTGFTTVYNRKTKAYEQIPVNAYDKSIHQGPASGKMNVINVDTGLRQQIDSKNFNIEKHVNLGANKQYFKCRNLLTDKIKNISIYEWKLVKDQFEILNLDQFNKAKQYRKELKWNLKK